VKRLSATSFFTATLALALLPASMGAQSENMTAPRTTNRFIDVLHASPETSENQYRKAAISEGQPILQPGTPLGPGQALIKPWGMPSTPTAAPTAHRKGWIGAGPGSLPLVVAVQPDVTQKYGTNPGVLQVYFAHQR
jgi:hypothetical protein